MADQEDHRLDYLLTEPMKAWSLMLCIVALVLPPALVALVIWGFVELVKWCEGAL